MKKLLCVVFALSVALPLYAQSGSTSDTSTMGPSSMSDPAMGSGSTDIQKEESDKPMGKSSTPSSDDMQKEEEIMKANPPSPAGSPGSSTTPSSGSGPSTTSP